MTTNTDQALSMSGSGAPGHRGNPSALG